MMVEMNPDYVVNHTHEVKMVDRKEISLSGVKRIVSFDSEEFLLETILGMLLLKGSGLELLKLDTHDGNVKIKGKINSYQYLENGKVKSKEESFLSKLFK